MAERQKDLCFQTGEVLFETDQPLAEAYFILEGSVDLELLLNDRKVHLVIESNHFIGDAAVLLETRSGGTLSYQGRAVAREPLRVAVIPVEVIRRELEGCSSLMRAWFASFTVRLLEVVDKLSRE